LRIAYPEASKPSSPHLLPQTAHDVKRRRLAMRCSLFGANAMLTQLPVHLHLLSPSAFVPSKMKTLVSWDGRSMIKHVTQTPPNLTKPHQKCNRTMLLPHRFLNHSEAFPQQGNGVFDLYAHIADLSQVPSQMPNATCKHRFTDIIQGLPVRIKTVIM